MSCPLVGWMQEGRKCIFVILWERRFCAQISFVFHCFLTSCFVHKNVNTLSWDLYHDSKCVILHVGLLSISTTNLISPKMSLTTFLHSNDALSPFLSLIPFPLSFQVLFVCFFEEALGPWIRAWNCRPYKTAVLNVLLRYMQKQHWNFGSE